MKRTLHLRREALTELTGSDLSAVAGGATVGDHCGPPFDTKFLDALTASVRTSLETIFATMCRCD